MIKYVRSFLCVILFSPLCLKAQKIITSAIVSGGGFHNNSSSNISWTLGEISTETYKNGSSILTQGIQQYFLTIVSTKDVSDITVKIYPNPTSSQLIIEVDNNVVTMFSLQNMQRQTIKIGNMQGKTTLIDMQNLPESFYVLTLLNTHKQIQKSYKISKIK